VDVVMAFFSVGPLEIAVLAVIALLVLGPARLPEAARSVGKGMRELREAMSGVGDDEDDDDHDHDEDKVAATDEKGADEEEDQTVPSPS
jgi:sec-independent protein translocase protein TatA